MFFYTKGMRKEEMVCYLHFGIGWCRHYDEHERADLWLCLDVG